MRIKPPGSDPPIPASQATPAQGTKSTAKPPAESVTGGAAIQLAVRNQNTNEVRTHHLPFSNQLVLGRGPESAVPLEGSSLSREHIIFEAEGHQAYITDLSSNGCWVNGARLERKQRYPINESDTIAIPGYEITFRLIVSLTASEAKEPATPSGRIKPDPATASTAEVLRMGSVVGIWKRLTFSEKVLMIGTLAVIALAFASLTR
ncbi:MAG: FHA domain-containing protein [Bryobacteraceae bacterium]